MPRRKAPKRKIKEVIVPEGDQGQQLSAEDRKAKLESFLEQYDLQVEMHLAQLEKDHKAVLKSIENTGRSMLLKLTADEASMSVLDYRKSLLRKDKTGRVSEADSILDIERILLSEPKTDTCKQTAPLKKAYKIPGFATPATGASRQTLWTATPKDTPMFDKRLLNVATGKP